MSLGLLPEVVAEKYIFHTAQWAFLHAMVGEMAGLQLEGPQFQAARKCRMKSNIDMFFRKKHLEDFSFKGELPL